MNKLIVTLVLIFSALIAGVALSLDNSSRPTPAQDDAAFEEWHEMPLGAREIVCDIFTGNNGPDIVRVAMTENGLSPVEIRARFNVMKSECK